MAPTQMRARSRSREPPVVFSSSKVGKPAVVGSRAQGGKEERELEVPARVWEELSLRQKEGIRWLWRLYYERQGGILADAAGSGKTTQLAGLAAALHHAGVLTGRRKGPGGKLGVLVICPALHAPKWHTDFVLRCPGLLAYRPTTAEEWPRAIAAAVRDHGVLVLPYEALLSAHGQLAANTEILIVDDDGRSLRSPNADFTLAAKRFTTPHRFVVSRTPVEEHMEELWSLVDFCRPGSLGSLPVFLEQLARPIEAAATSAGARPGSCSVATRAMAAGCASALRNMTSHGILCRARPDPAEGSVPTQDTSDFLAFVRPLRPLLEGGELRKEDVQAQQPELKRMLRAMMGSIQDCAGHAPGTLTWTGREGVAGVPPPDPNSVEGERLLQDRVVSALERFAAPHAPARRPPKAQRLEAAAGEDADEVEASAGDTGLPPNARGIAETILRAFWDKRAGSQHRLATDQVLRSLAPAVRPESRDLLKGLLQHLCTLSKPSREGDPGVWSLNKEFWPSARQDRAQPQKVMSRAAHSRPARAGG